MCELKVLVVTPALTPYRVALFNAIQRFDSCELSVISLTQREPNRLWKLDSDDLTFEHRVLEGAHVRRGAERSLHINKPASGSIARIKPDVIVTAGYDQPAYWEAMLAAATLGSRYVLWSGTTRQSSRTQLSLRSAFKRVAVSAADAFIAYGQDAGSYLKSLGATESRIGVSLNTVDMDHYRSTSADFRASSEFSAQRSQRAPFLMLFVGQLIPRKGISELLAALARLRDEDIGLMVAGAGPLEGRLRDRCLRDQIPNVTFEGYLQLPDIVRAYSLADVLVVPSRSETWGLVVNEALATGTYSLVSQRAGARELIAPGFNGELFDPYDVGHLASRILGLKSQVSSIRARRADVAEHACAAYSLQGSASDFVAALKLSFLL